MTASPETEAVSIAGPGGGSGEPSRGGSSAIGCFQEGPSLVDIATPVIAFLRRWLPRPLSVWQLELAGDAWPPLLADLLTRTVTFLWFLAGSIAISLIVIGVIALTLVLIGI